MTANNPLSYSNVIRSFTHATDSLNINFLFITEHTSTLSYRDMLAGFCVHPISVIRGVSPDIASPPNEFCVMIHSQMVCLG